MRIVITLLSRSTVIINLIHVLKDRLRVKSVQRLKTITFGCDATNILASRILVCVALNYVSVVAYFLSCFEAFCKKRKIIV